MPPKAAPKPAAKAAAKAAPAAKPAAKPAAAKPAAKAAAPAAKPAAKAAAPAKPAAKAVAGSGTGVYVKGLGSANVEAVKALFAAAGAVSQVRLRRNKFAIVIFDNAAAVKKACDSFNNKEVQGQQLSVVAAKAGPKSNAHEGTATVFVSPVFRSNTTRNQIRGIFEGCGKITKLRTYHGNYAFVTFDSAASAAKAIKDKNGQTFRNRQLTVKASVRK